MRIFFLAILFSFLSSLCTQSILAQQAEVVDVVWDLDWTLLYAVEKPILGDRHGTYIHTQEGYFRVADWAGQVLQFLDKHPGFRQSFYSGASEGRLMEAMEQIRLPDGRRAVDIAFRIKSKADLVSVPDAPEEARFPDRFKKDMVRIDPIINLLRTIMVDDIYRFLPHAQEKNMLWLQETFDFVNSAAELGKGEFQPPSSRHWSLERNKLLWVLGVLMTALEKAPRGDYIDAVETVERADGREVISRYANKSLPLYIKGLILLRDAGLDAPSVPLPKAGCRVVL
ncbi:MAG: hypothetical protein H6624_08460 [Bdellovibrionaceae bacterium]|nr:hypothetical protein [Bdellovibrionales bacterium]MCB9084364.1 hypothetical protein [Pseudobdellovibrionaceae bacterium]